MLACMKPQTSGQTLRFLRRGEAVALDNVAPDRTLLDVLREDLHLSATKEGCGEGDCGACTVVLGELVNGQLQHKAINSCIRLAHSVDGMAVYTAEDIAAPTGELHPVQEAMVQCHGSQCGFCTPGFVMSLFGMYQNHGGRPVGREQAQADLSGNLCRCTGYRPILDAAAQMGELPLPAGCAVDTAATVAALKALKKKPAADTPYQRPTTLPALLQARAASPKAQVVAGCTDVGLWVTKQHKRFDQVLDVTAARELQRVESYQHHIAIGAAVSLTDAFAALVKERPQLLTFSRRFAGLPVRNSGTLGGNVANGSPIGDAPPVLMALDAQIELRRGAQTRRMPLTAFYIDYMKNELQPGEFVQALVVPTLPVGHQVRAYKISKRFDCDISALCAAFSIVLDGDMVKQVRLAYGGMAGIVKRAAGAEAALTGQPWSQASVDRAKAALAGDFKPLSDMRASAAYRMQVAQNLLQRFWLETRTDQPLPLQATSVWSVMPHEV